jgi:hypothetical protein
VRLKQHGENSHKPHGAVIRIATPRQSAATRPAVSVDWPDPRGPVWPRVVAMARRIRRFNRDAAHLATHAPERIAQSRRDLCDEAPTPSGAQALERLVEVYAMADALAIQRQAWVRRGWRLLLSLGVLGVLALAEHAHAHDHPPQFLAAYIVVLVGAFVLYIAMKSQRTQPRFLEYRALAEALRVAFFWRVAGLPGEPVDHYPGHIARVVESISMALRTEEIRVEPPPPTKQGLASAIECWAEGQRRFFERASLRDQRRGHRFKLASNLAIAAGIVVALAGLALHPSTGTWLLVGSDEAYHWVILGMVALPALGGALATYTDRLGHETQARQYERMLDLFDLALAELREHAADPSRQREILVRLASEALSEHAHWVVLHRQRPFEIRTGG